MEEKAWKMILADGTELTGFRQNGNNYVSQERVDEAVFEDNLSTLTLTDGETEITMNNAVLIQQVKYTDGWYLCFRELTPQELQNITILSKIDYLAMMANIDLEEV